MASEMYSAGDNRGGGPRVLHADKECYKLRPAKNIQVNDPECFPGDWETYCQHCTD